MENDTNRIGKQNDNPQQHNKKYPGYAPDVKSGSPTDEFIDTDRDTLLAEKGPVRNPNYHDLDDENTTDNSIRSVTTHRKDEKTLEDYNKTDPKRDINKDKAAENF